MVLAPIAPAGLRTTHTRVVAFAVPLLAVRLLAIATFFGEAAVPQAAFFDTRLRICDLFFELGSVFATGTRAVITADLAGGKALAVHLEAERLLASTSNPAFFSGVGGSLHVVEVLIEGVLLLLNGLSHGHVDILAGVVVGEDVDGVDHLEGIVEFGELLVGWKIEEGVFAQLLVHLNNFNICYAPHNSPHPHVHFSAYPLISGASSYSCILCFLHTGSTFRVL